jgi:hypothetical protein
MARRRVIRRVFDMDARSLCGSDCIAAVVLLPGLRGQGPLRSRLWQAGPDGGPTVHHKSAIRTIGNSGFGSQKILQGRNAKP